MFSSIQQSGLVLVLLGINLFLSHWLEVITGYTAASDMMFIMGALTSAVLWPALFQLLRQIRRGFEVR